MGRCRGRSHMEPSLIIMHVVYTNLSALGV